MKYISEKLYIMCIFDFINIQFNIEFNIEFNKKLDIFNFFNFLYL